MNTVTATTAATVSPNVTCARPRATALEDFAAYLGRVAAHGRPDLHIELREAKRQVVDHGGYADLTQALGIERTAIVEAGGIGLLRVTTVGESRKAPIESRYFVPTTAEDKNSKLALIIPVWDGLGGDLEDLLAIRLDRPAQFLVRSGYAKCLGAWNIAEVLDGTTFWALPDEIHPSLVLAPDPLKWLQSDCRGACILHKAWLTHSLVGIRAVTAHDESHAAALHKLLVWSDAPKVFLRRQREAA